VQKQTYRLEYTDGGTTTFVAENDEDAREKAPRWAYETPYTLMCVPDNGTVGSHVPL